MNKEIDRRIVIAIYNILYVNDLACACVIDLQDYINKIQDKETQKIYGALRRRQRSYEEIICGVLENQLDKFAEYNSYMDEHVQPLLSKLTNEITNLLDSCGVENARFIALTETARTIIGYSVINVEKRIKECLYINGEVVNLRGYKLSDMKRVAENLSKWVSRKCPNIDLNRKDKIINAYRELDKILTNKDIINQSIINADK